MKTIDELVSEYGKIPIEWIPFGVVSSTPLEVELEQRFRERECNRRKGTAPFLVKRPIVEVSV